MLNHDRRSKMAMRTLTVQEFADSLAAKTATPGGGSVAAVTAAHAAALAAMVLEFTIGKPKFAEFEQVNTANLLRFTDLRRQALSLADRDAQAYGELNSLWKLPKDSPIRAESWDAAVSEAIDAPQAILETAAEIATLSAQLYGKTSSMLASDLAIAVDLATVAARAARHNVEVNLPSVTDSNDRQQRRARMLRAAEEALAASTAFNLHGTAQR